MRTPDDLPLDLPARFSVSDAADRGVTAGRLRRADLRTPYYGIRAHGIPMASTLLERCLEYAPRLAPGQFFSHETALERHGAPMPEWPYQPALHVSTLRPAHPPRTAGIRGHRLQVREPAYTADALGLPVEHPVRAWRQTGRLWRLDDLIVAADYLISGEVPLASYGDLRDEVREMGDVRNGILTRALREVRTGPRSSRETRLRLLLTRSGLPHPEVTWSLFDARGTFVAELDLAYPRYRVAVEYDGRVHAEDAKQFAKDADRWDAIRRQGWEHVRILNHHMQAGGRRAVAKVAGALTAAGWRPGR